MLNKSKSIVLICGATSIFVTAILYLMTFDNIFTIPMRWISLMFLIFTECIGTVKALQIKKSIFGVTNIITSIFHLGFVLAMSVIFVNIFPLYIKSYILLNIIFLSILFITDTIIIYFNGYIGEKNKSLSESQAVMDSLYTNATALLTKYCESPYKKDLEEISEMLRYSDNSALSTDEVAILDKLEELQKLLAENNEAVPQKISDIKNAVKLRSLKIKSTKRGSY